MTNIAWHGINHLVVTGDEVMVARLDGNITIGPRRVLTPLRNISCRAQKTIIFADEID